MLENVENTDNPQNAELYERALQFALKISREHVDKAKAELKRTSTQAEADSWKTSQTTLLNDLSSYASVA